LDNKVIDVIDARL